MTPFERACVAAFLARRELGKGSAEYKQALEDMELLRCRLCGEADGHRLGCRARVAGSP